MPANNSGAEARRMAAKFPGRVGHIYAPGGWRGPFSAFPYALDNGAFIAWKCSRPFDGAAFRRLLYRAAAAAIPPRWVAVPDVVMDARATLASWAEWAPVVASYGWPLAFVAQNGHTAADVPADAAVVFVGGDTAWKRRTAPIWCAAFPRVHVGRVNTERWLRYFDLCGAESVDGSGFFRGDRAQTDGLWYYLADAAGTDDTGASQPRLLAVPAQLDTSQRFLLRERIAVTSLSIRGPE